MLASAVQGRGLVVQQYPVLPAVISITISLSAVSVVCAGLMPSHLEGKMWFTQGAGSFVLIFYFVNVWGRFLCWTRSFILVVLCTLWKVCSRSQMFHLLFSKLERQHRKRGLKPPQRLLTEPLTFFSFTCMRVWHVEEDHFTQRKWWREQG